MTKTKFTVRLGHKWADDHFDRLGSCYSKEAKDLGSNRQYSMVELPTEDVERLIGDTAYYAGRNHDDCQDIQRAARRALRSLWLQLPEFRVMIEDRARLEGVPTQVAD